MLGQDQVGRARGFVEQLDHGLQLIVCGDGCGTGLPCDLRRRDLAAPHARAQFDGAQCAPFLPAEGMVAHETILEGC
jgi:hypothetical protein